MHRAAVRAPTKSWLPVWDQIGTLTSQARKCTKLAVHKMRAIGDQLDAPIFGCFVDLSVVTAQQVVKVKRENIREAVARVSQTILSAINKTGEAQCNSP
jgi:hypothetical protein